jgi:hyperosmotically inducible protein
VARAKVLFLWEPVDDQKPMLATNPEATPSNAVREEIMRASGFSAVLATALLGAPVLVYASSGSPASALLEERVRHELASLPYYTVFDNLAFRVDADQVTLIGQVTQPVVKEDAERAVRKLAGVRSVNSQIEVLPLSRADDQIRRSTYYAVYGYGPLERYGFGSQPGIRIVVKNGHVTLTGAVANAMDRAMAYQRANTVPGVFSVTNNLLIEI